MASDSPSASMMQMAIASWSDAVTAGSLAERAVLLPRSRWKRGERDEAIRAVFERLVGGRVGAADIDIAVALTGRRLPQLERDGGRGPAVDGVCDYIAALREQAAGHTVSPESRLAEAKAALAEMQLEIRRGEYVPIDEGVAVSAAESKFMSWRIMLIPLYYGARSAPRRPSASMWRFAKGSPLAGGGEDQEAEASVRRAPVTECMAGACARGAA